VKWASRTFLSHAGGDGAIPSVAESDEGYGETEKECANVTDIRRF
jgi:hypothetical protein